MHSGIVLATTVFAQLLCQGFTALTPCATPGLYLSTDQNYCFGYIPVTREWNYHVVICDGYATKLINIDSAEKQTMVQTFVNDLSLSTSLNIFIGLTNILTDDTYWVWYGGNITSYTNWADGQPVVSYRVNCAYMTLTDYKWYSSNCLSSRLGLCERDATAADRAGST